MLLPTEKVDGKFSDLNDEGGLILSYNGENSMMLQKLLRTKVN